MTNLKTTGRLWIYGAALLASITAAVKLTAAEYQGAVRANGLPVPGAAITVTQGDRKILTTSDEQGRFTFADLPDGSWTLTVEMLGFGKITRNVDSPAAAPSTIELKLLTQAELITSLGGKTIAQVAPPAAFAARGARGANAPQGGPAAAGRGRAGAPAVPAGPAPDAFQQVSVNQLADPFALSTEGNLNAQDIAGLSQTAANSLAVQGSVSSALGLAAQGDFGPPGGFGPGGFPGGPGGPGFGGVNALSADGAGIPGVQNNGEPGAAGAQAAGPGGGPGGPGGRGPGAPGGGPGGGPGGRGPGGGGPGGGGPGGGGFGGGPGGGRGGPGGPGGRGGPGRGRPDAVAFGNGRPAGRSLYNGNVSFSLSNSALDARSYSVTGANIAKPSYGNGRGGFTFGGPVQIPKLLSADKRVSFTVDYQVQRNRTGQLSQAVNMPTALERTGDFSQTLIQGSPVTVYDPTTGLPFVGNKIPLARLNSTSLGLLSYFPNPNIPFAARNYQTTWNGLNNTNSLNVRLQNINLTSKDRLNFGLGYQTGTSVTPNLFQFIDTGSNRSSNSNLGWNRRFTSRVANTLALTFSRTRQTQTPFFANTVNVAGNLGIQGTSQNPVNWGPPNLNFTNYGGLTDGTYSLNRNQTVGLTNTLTISHGRHNLSIGAEYRRQQLNPLSDSNGRGTYTFTGLATANLVNGVAQAGTGYDLADFLLSRPATSSIRYGNPGKYFRGSSYAAFFNDDFRLSTKLSLVAGLRWDYSAPFSELYNRIVNLDISPSYSTVTPVLPGQTAQYSGALPNTLLRPDRNNISPRLGLAWRPLKRPLIVRAGYGVYYNSAAYTAIANNLAQQPPFAQTLSTSSSITNPLNIQTGFLGGTNQSVNNTFAIDPNYKIGYAQTWNLTLQDNLPLGIQFTAGYQGTKGTRLDQRFIPNSVAPGAPVSKLPNFYTYETSGGNSMYHAAQFQLNRRLSRGLTVNTSYQFSKSIDNAGTGGQGPIAQDWQNLSAERALSSFNVPHNLTINFQYSTGAGRGGGAQLRGVRGAIFKDWTVSGNLVRRSGTPLTATVGGANSQVAGTGVSNTIRANATGQSIQADGMNFNTAAFSAPTAGTFGNAGRNTIPGPTMFQLNGQLGRIFRLGERRTADLQFQANNILNRVTITNWGTVLGSNNFGLVSAASQMRRITTTLRFRF
ncbi:MAG: TonB-dependent receptor [Bryobacteraceae bacterium]